MTLKLAQRYLAVLLYRPITSCLWSVETPSLSCTISNIYLLHHMLTFCNHEDSFRLVVELAYHITYHHCALGMQCMLYFTDLFV